MHIERPRTYRATLVPKDTPADQVEELADAGKLPTKELTATSADHAEQLAHQATGHPVLRVERIEEVAA